MLPTSPSVFFAHSAPACYPPSKVFPRRIVCAITRQDRVGLEGQEHAVLQRKEAAACGVSGGSGVPGSLNGPPATPRDVCANRLRTPAPAHRGSPPARRARLAGAGGVPGNVQVLK